jgi:hypothetical protein
MSTSTRAPRVPPPGTRLEAALPLRWVEAPEACRYCGEPTRWRTATNRRTHPTCSDAYVYGMTDAAISAALFDLAAAFPGSMLLPPAPPVARPRGRTGRCTWCPKPGIGLVGDGYLHCGDHLLWNPLSTGRPTR